MHLYFLFLFCAALLVVSPFPPQKNDWSWKKEQRAKSENQTNHPKRNKGQKN